MPVHYHLFLADRTYQSNLLSDRKKDRQEYEKGMRISMNIKLKRDKRQTNPEPDHNSRKSIQQ